MYIPNFVEPENKFDRLWHELTWEKRPDAPRREYWFNTLNRPYSYGKGAGLRTYFPQVNHPVIAEVTDALERKLGFRYEACFLNGYETARDALGWHADDDPGIDHLYPIAVVSLYGNGSKNGFRTIQVKPIAAENKEVIETYVLEDGSLFLMPAGSQSTHMHRIPKAGHEVRPRISLTFRKLV